MSPGTNTQFSDKKYWSKNHHRTSEIISRLDGRLHRLSEDILPKEPYLLSVPSDIPYRHSSRFVNTWYEATPFDHTEEQLQYTSFLPHQGEDESLLKVEGSWADDQGNRIDEDAVSPRTVPATGRNTPADPGYRKKISLKDYKTKGKGSPEPSSEPAPAKSPQPTESQIARVEAVSRDPTEVTEDSQQSQSVQQNHKVQEQTPSLKIPDTDGHSTPTRPQVQKSDLSSPAKRQKLSPSPEASKAPVMATKVGPQPVVLKMPRLLSPTLPSPERQTGLPELLSPLLPPSLAKAIQTPSDTISIGSPLNGSQTRTDPVRAILASADLDNSPSNKGGLAPVSGRVRSDSQHSARDSLPGTPSANKLGAKPLSKIGSKLGTPLQRASPGPRQRHIITLKYGKKNRKRVEALLKFAPRPKKVPIKSEVPVARHAPEVKLKKEEYKRDTIEAVRLADPKPKKDIPREEAVEVHREKDNKSKTSVSNAARPEKKRRSEESPPPATKRLKPSIESEKRPSTPLLLSGKTPLAGQSKSTFSTPKKELKSTAMRRVESSDGADVPTPTGERNRVLTPLAAPKPSPQPLTTTTSREEQRQQWGSMNTKFFALGRTLKHEGTSLGPSANGEVGGYSAKGDPGWNSILPYHIFLFRASRKHPHLHGLVVQLGAVCRQLVHKCNIDRLARDPLPDDYFNSAPTPGSDGNTKTNEDAEKYKKVYIDFKDDLIQNARELQTAWLDGSRHLPPDLLKREYPLTWSKRAKDSSLRLKEQPTPSKLPTDFYLPMDANTTAFEASRFGLTFLEEWTTKEKVDWKARIDF